MALSVQCLCACTVQRILHCIAARPSQTCKHLETCSDLSPKGTLDRAHLMLTPCLAGHIERQEMQVKTHWTSIASSKAEQTGTTRDVIIDDVYERYAHSPTGPLGLIAQNFTTQPTGSTTPRLKYGDSYQRRHTRQDTKKMEASECMRQLAEVAIRCLAIAYTYLTMSEGANHHSSLHELKPGVGHKPIDCISPRPLGSST
ncbi:hypothetical protein HDV57DRAFT_511800 [Trichoderma longibrachiatum]|uniref:Uncharacterized protein n=1 Tax=Trichoderma longibrachiatum ATCC 18648 TaxID=983965 RepID=A0A2T4CFA5_TRILO|nr:hypothetical protein M440DRAFT_1460219 [Trichoderma longibrachiatum ATCC 18648]